MLVRQLSRAAVNNIDGGTAFDPKGNSVAYKMVGLAKYYDNGFGGGSDPQVIKASGALTLAMVRQLMRRVCPSHDGFGVGPDALMMSRRCRDLLVSLERADNTQPVFMPDPRNGERRYHFDGVPVYVGLVREDEDTSGSDPAFQDSEPFTYDDTSIYALRLGGPTGARILHMGGASQSYGVQVNRIPTGTSAEEGFRVEGYYTWFIPERQSVARLWGVDISGEAA